MPSPALEDWLKYAAEPPPLAPGKRFHVFISYRSVNRAWVLRLYDVLRHLRYETFLDQYVLAAAAPLALSLGEALDGSQTAILIWSSAFEDSEWCKKEYAALEALEAAGKGFRFVVAKVDAAPLPALAAGKTYVDFSEDRDGPCGSGLLRLLWGLAGKPLPPAAVALAADVDEQLRVALGQIRAARLNGQAERLLDLSRSTSLAWQTSPTLSCEVAEGLIALKRPGDALQLLEQVESRFTRAVRPRQLRGLALARGGDWQKAQTVLGELYAASEIDPETLGIYARTWMDRYKANGQRLHLLKSRDLYRQAFEAAPGDYYTGVNAASKSLLLGERETAMQLAKRVEAIVGATAVPGDYWRTATVAEVQLLQGKLAAAAPLYEQAVLIAPEDHGSHGSTRGQAELLLEALQPTAADRASVLACFDHDGCRP